MKDLGPAILVVAAVAAVAYVVVVVIEGGIHVVRFITPSRPKGK